MRVESQTAPCRIANNNPLVIQSSLSQGFGSNMLILIEITYSKLKSDFIYWMAGQTELYEVKRVIQSWIQGGGGIEYCN